MSTETFKKEILKAANISADQAELGKLEKKLADLKAREIAYREQAETALQDAEKLKSEIHKALGGGLDPSALVGRKKALLIEATECEQLADAIAAEILPGVEAEIEGVKKTLHNKLMRASADRKSLLLEELDSKARQLDGIISEWEAALSQLHNETGVASLPAQSTLLLPTTGAPRRFIIWNGQRW